MGSAKDWGRAFATQANADFKTFNKLQGCYDVPQCHKLQFLQMACEKLCKAHIYKGTRDRDLNQVVSKLQSSHLCVAKHLPTIVRQYLPGKSGRQISERMRQFRHLSRQIELLAPSVDAGGRCPENCEYPWEIGGENIRVPATDRFTDLDLTKDSNAQTLLKCVKYAILQLLAGV